VGVSQRLADWTGRDGDPAGARAQFAALLSGYGRFEGKHPVVLATRANLACWTGEAGDAAGARDQFATLLPSYERVLGSHHPHTLITCHSVAYWARQTDTPQHKG
jgi:hypothetical protein